MSYFNTKNLIKLIIKWKKHFIIISVLSVVLSIVFSSSFFIKPKFSSEAIVYPVNLSLYSDESATEQMLQLLNSIYIQKKIIKEFDFANRFNIEDDDFSLLIGVYRKDIIISRTEYQSVKIEALDIDPNIASNIVDSIITYYNEKVKRLHKRKVKELLDINQKALINKEVTIDSLENEFKILSVEYGILDYEKQSERLTEEYVNLLSNRSSSSFKEIANKISNLEKYGGQHLRIKKELYFERERFNILKSENEKSLLEYEKNISYAQIISYPFPAAKSVYPRRKLIVLLGTFSAIFLTFIVIVLIESKNYLLKE